MFPSPSIHLIDRKTVPVIPREFVQTSEPRHIASKSLLDFQMRQVVNALNQNINAEITCESPLQSDWGRHIGLHSRTFVTMISIELDIFAPLRPGTPTNPQIQSVLNGSIMLSSLV